ncbi:prephenate dehydratase [Carboxylicivirga sp. A043]|uniref:prephenate dehydratase n=1 Tax=Carboxylicivirga litoralis TaxID=2816963 RepID=UPI0021CB3B33|nr:prephenate dehydratase [Carboxylicivirga sp. A043]MCU4156242.1 prephenate dehydratase [Carboxylicivirga sp. A043]
MNQTKKKIAIQGWPGANHEIAAKAYFEDENLEIIPCLTFPDLFETLKKDRDCYGIIAIENTLVGSLLPNYTMLKDSDLVIIGEYKLRIKHQFLALPGQTIEDIKEVYSHPMAIAQCEAFFKQYPHIKLIESEDTALSAKRIADEKLEGIGAIASELAAEMYELKTLAKNIETNKKNFTRFLIVSDRGKTEVDNLLLENRVNKSSVVFSLPHEEGSLSKILTILAFYNINLTKIQSLPIVGQEWEYLFYVDLTFTDYKRYLQSLDAIRPLTSKLKSLGEYEKGGQSYPINNGHIETQKAL